MANEDEPLAGLAVANEDEPLASKEGGQAQETSEVVTESQSSMFADEFGLPHAQ